MTDRSELPELCCTRGAKLDRIEQKLDEILTHVKPQVILQMPPTDADRAFAKAFREAVRTEGGRSKPKRRRRFGLF